jgi:hypothetical protein
MPEIILADVGNWKVNGGKSIENYAGGLRVTTSAENPYGEICGGLDASNND